MKATVRLVVVAACGGSSNATADAPADGVADASPDSPAASGGLGTVGNVTPATCPQGAPARRSR